MFQRLVLKLLLLNVVVTNISFASSLQPFCHDDERSALLQFKESFFVVESECLIEGVYPKVLQWKSEGESSNCCLWDGILCDENTGHMISVDVSNSCLFGSINSNSTLFSLLYLQRLNLADNNFNFSQIPSAIGQFSDLTYLNLSASYFYGQVPFEISNLIKLTTLVLSLNYNPSTQDKFLQLKNPNLKTLLQNLTRLEILSLSYVNISSVVPNLLTNFPSLATLKLKDCELYGEFPAKIFNLPNLRLLDLRFNYHLTGYLPKFHHPSPLSQLNLEGTNFSGALPFSIENLRSLNLLNVYTCHFSGPIPSSLGKLTQLTTLDLGSNDFSDHIPSSLQNLTQLSTLRVDSNRMSGPLPSWLGNLTKLNALDFSSNEFNGPIPPSLFTLVNLEILSLVSNNLGGSVRFDMFLNMNRLNQLQLGHNNFSFVFGKTNVNATVSKFKILVLSACNLTEFPAFLRYQRDMEWLQLSGNNIQGPIPKWMWNTSTDTLLYLGIENNFLTGEFHPPAVLVLPWVNLQVLQAASNMLQGAVPIPPPTIGGYDLSNNMLSGEISPSFCNQLTSLLSLDLSDNKVSGMIPQCLVNLTDSLSVLNLRNNSLRGTIPQMCQKNGGNLRQIDLCYNKLQGKLPKTFSNCVLLESLSVSNNRLNDVFPHWLGRLPELRLLTMRHNEFHGLIGKPKTKFEFPKLRVIDLSYNNFTGELPYQYIFSWDAMKSVDDSDFMYMNADSSFCGFKLCWKIERPHIIIVTFKGREFKYEGLQDVFVFIDLSSNKFEGKIPELIGDLNGLHSLNLSNNMLTGSIPSSLGNLTLLEALDLSGNYLSGKIPQEFLQLNSLVVFNVSHNNLTGTVPQGGQFSTFSSSSFEENPGLCGDPLPKKCTSSPQLPPIEEDQESGSAFKLDWKFITSGFVSGLVVGVVLCDRVTTRWPAWFWWLEDNFVYYFGR